MRNLTEVKTSGKGEFQKYGNSGENVLKKLSDNNGPKTVEQNIVLYLVGFALRSSSSNRNTVYVQWVLTSNGHDWC